MRGFFAVGCEGISKAMNIGAIFRTTHAFGGSYVFTVRASYDKGLGRRADTSSAHKNMPLFSFPDVDAMILPKSCKLVGVELTDDAVELPSFHHPQQAAYVFGPERDSLSPAMQNRCDYMLKIPTKFCINVSLAAGIVIYDRCQQLGRFPPRPVWEGAPLEAVAKHVHGPQLFRTGDPALRKIRGYQEDAPDIEELEAAARAKFRD